MEQRHFAVLVVGAGASGLGAAIRLGQAGVDDLAVLEKAGSLGGTWRDNTYPGCACDVPSALYSYSFAPNPGSTRAFGALEPRVRPGGQAGRGDRHRCVGGPVRPGDRAPRRAAAPVPAHGAVGAAEAGPPRPGTGAVPAAAVPGAAAGVAQRRVRDDG